MIKLRRWIFVLFSAFSVSLMAEEPLDVASPDGNLHMTISCDATGQLTYSFRADGKELIKSSMLGLPGGKLSANTRRTVDTVWKPLWGKRSIVPDRFNELTLDMQTYKLVARAYDDGVAFRVMGGAADLNEKTQFNFAGNYTAWYYNGENHNLGPLKISETGGERMPVMTIKVDETCYLAVHEADLGNAAPMKLLFNKDDTLVRVSASRKAAPKTPSEAWRVIMYGRTPGALIDSHLIELLCPPPAEGMDFSWVKAGVTLWDWRINGAQVKDASEKNGVFRYRMNYASWVRMVDFAAEQKFAFLMLDADWYGKEHAKESNPTVGGYAADARKLITYAKEKNVGIWLYLNDVAGRNYPIEETLKTYSEWGAVGIKYGFMKGSPEEKNLWTRKITELCAKYKLMCLFHDGPVHPYGQMRTWPNAVTREFCQAQLDGRKVYQPKTFVTSVFVNMIAGPLDMNNGVADLTQKGRADNGKPVPSTLCAEAARTLIVFSGLICIPDIPENYRKYPELLQFYSSMKMPWRESRTLSGVIGEHIVMARQAEDGVWLIAAATNEEPRELDIPLSFLQAGKYEALILQDGDDSDYKTYVESFKQEKRMVTPADKIHVKLAPGGGACLILKEIK